MDANWWDLIIATATGAGAAVIVVIVLSVTAHVVGRRRPSVSRLRRQARVPVWLLVGLVAVNPAIEILRPLDPPSPWWEAAAAVARVLLIVAIGWLGTTIVLFAVDTGLRRSRIGRHDDRRARQLRTQTTIIRRLILTVAVVLTVGTALVTLPGARALGTSVLASAGLVSVVAALAAQSVLGNVFAGIQIAFNDALRLDDVVVIEGDQGRVTELTLTYVVVLLWDERCLVLPCTYFTTNTFLNLTRNSPRLLGTVEFDLDWNVDVAGLRAEFERVLETTELWDRRSQGLSVTEATNGYVRVRADMTAEDAGSLWRLRTLVREELVRWLTHHDDEAVPRQRLQVVTDGEPARLLDAAR